MLKALQQLDQEAIREDRKIKAKDRAEKEAANGEKDGKPVFRINCVCVCVCVYVCVCV